MSHHVVAIAEALFAKVANEGAVSILKNEKNVFKFNNANYTNQIKIGILKMLASKAYLK